MNSTKSVLGELVLVSVIGLVVGLTANAMHSDGVKLGRDYFPRRVNGFPTRVNGGPTRPTTGAESSGATVGPGTTTVAAGATADGATADGSTRSAVASEDGAATADAASPAFEPDPLADVVEYLDMQGFNVIRHDEVVAMYEDPFYQSEAYVLIDARDTKNYASGHIPGAYQLDHYRIDRYIDEVLPIAQSALKVALYCNGGDCEDSEFAANELLARGLNPGKVFVYPGGMDLWKERDLPVELGERLSGEIVQGRTLIGGSHD